MRFHKHSAEPLPFFETGLHSTVELLVPLLFPSRFVDESNTMQGEPMQDVTPVKSNLAQMQSGHYSQSEARRWETETKEGQECQFESMTSQEPHVI